MTGCAQPGCTGRIEDEYCDRCGSRAPVAASAPSGGRQFSTSGSRSAPPNPEPAGLGAAALPSTTDPARHLLDDPQVAEHKRYCWGSGCGAPVGRAKGGREGRLDGFCPQCGRPYSFRPALSRGHRIAGQYEVYGVLARGGFGWIYLAWDHGLGTWVVLKGLLAPEDKDGREAAAAELDALVGADHQHIVTVHNRVRHPHPRFHRDVDYLVMAYVAGPSLKDLHLERRGQNEWLPLEYVCTLMLQALGALEHLHGLGLLYCDLKPDNMIVTGDGLRLVDLGAVRPQEDRDRPLFGTPGYQDPDITTHGPSVATDLFTVARTMAVLSFDFPGFTSEHQADLPDPATVDVLSRHDSYYRLLRRATNPEPDRRFASAAEMAEQLASVRREILAKHSGTLHPGVSTLFGPELTVASATPDSFPRPGADPPEVGADAALALPDRQIDTGDPQAGRLSTLIVTTPAERLQALARMPASVETRLRTAHTRIELGDYGDAREDLDALDFDHPDDWRVGWCRALLDLATGDSDSAADRFDAVLDAFPGEAAPKIALGLCAERDGDHARAAAYYGVVWRTDHAYLSAAFGRARCLFALGDPAEAAATLESVPVTSRYRTTARLCAILCRARGRRDQEPLVSGFPRDAEQLTDLDLAPERHHHAVVDVLTTALRWHRDGGPRPAPQASGSRDDIPERLLGHPFDETGLSLGLEQTYRSLAALATRPAERIALVNEANAIRPWTWF